MPISCEYHLRVMKVCWTAKPWFRLKLKAIHRFTSTAMAVEDISAMQEGKISKGLKQFLQDQVVDKGKGKESLAVIEPKLGRPQVLRPMGLGA